ncbi:MAG: amino acid ABC transporter ATP-binding protein [Rubrivivax sp.]|nr:MAG: amino acid ABC transporter ATP-binding protein [Rubrivivax sp.]
MGMAALLDNLLAARAATPVVRVAGLRKRHGKHEVLRGLDLELRRGETVALLGCNGAGKSTLLRCVAGLEGFHDGTLTVQGRPPVPPGGRRRAVSLVFQGLNLAPHLSIGANLMASPGLAERPGAVLEVLARVGLATHFDVLPGGLSPAQQQRVVIARAIVPNPAVLLCDDVTTPDDPAQAGEVGVLLRSLAANGMAVLISTHDLSLAGTADRVVFLHDGQAHESGPSADLLGAPQTRELRRFLNGVIRR